MKPRHLFVLLAAQVLAHSLGSDAVAAAKAMQGAIKPVHGRPTIFIDGKPELPQVYALTDFRGGRFTWEEIPKRNLQVFTELGFRLFQVDVWLQDIWSQGGKIDMGLVRRQVRGVLDVNPKAAVFIRFHVNAPFWWNRAHPQECVTYADGPADPKEYGPPWQIHFGDTQRSVRHSLASRLWKKDSSEKMREVLRGLAASPEGRNVVAWQVAGGVYGEWHPWGFPNHEQDTSAPMAAYFRQWLKAKYKEPSALAAAWNDPQVTFENAAIPDLAARNRTADGVFRDPKRERAVIDYYGAQQDSIADAILTFSEIAKTTWPRPLIVGAFYGYFFSTFGRQAVGAHLRMSRVFDSPWVDYVSAPQSYFGESHEMGGAGQSRSLVESGRLAGKLFLDEMDTGTHLKKPSDGYDPSDPKNDAKFRDDVALLRRNTIHPILRGHGLWYYDFGAVYGSGHWDHPVFIRELEQLRRVLTKAWQEPHAAAADVLVVYDLESVLVMQSRWSTINESEIDRLSSAVYRSGAVADFVKVDDLPKVDLGRYKAVLFAHAEHLDPAAAEFIATKVARAGRHLVWTYMPGYFDGQTTNVANVSRVTGVEHTRITFPGGPKDDPKIEVSAPGFARAAWKLDDPVSPMMAIVDKAATPIGRLGGTQHVVVAKKTLADSIAWVGTLSLHDPAVLRDIFTQAGAHIYERDGDAVLAGMNLLMVHTANGGVRSIALKNGRKVSVTLPPRSTALLDAETGAFVLAPEALPLR